MGLNIQETGQLGWVGRAMHEVVADVPIVMVGPINVHEGNNGEVLEIG